MKKKIAGRMLSAEVHNLCDIGIELSGNFAQQGRAIESELSAALKDDPNFKMKSISYQTNINAYIGFLKTQDAQKALSKFVSGGVSLESASTSQQSSSGSLVTCSLTVSPSFVVQ
eukprot:gene36402-49035_t